MTNETQLYEIDDEDPEMPTVRLESAEALLVLSEMMIERGITTVAQLGDLPPLDAETKAKYLARAKQRAEEVGLDVA